MAPPDTTVAYDTDDVILDPGLSSHPGGDVVAFRWIVDDSTDVEGMGGETSVRLPAGQHRVILVAEDQAGRQDRDTMLVTVLANVGVPGAAASETVRLSVPVPFDARGSASLPIWYDLPAAGEVTLAIYDLQGRVTRILQRGELAAPGPHVTHWDLRDAAGRSVPAGTYVCRLRSRGVTVSRKLVVVR